MSPTRKNAASARPRLVYRLRQSPFPIGSDCRRMFRRDFDEPDADALGDFGHKIGANGTPSPTDGRMHYVRALLAPPKSLSRDHIASVETVMIAKRICIPLFLP